MKKNKIISMMAGNVNKELYTNKIISLFGDNLMAYWTHEESTGHTAVDHSGNGRDGTRGGDTPGQTGIGDKKTSCAMENLSGTKMLCTALNTAVDWTGNWSFGTYVQFTSTSLANEQRFFYLVFNDSAQYITAHVAGDKLSIQTKINDIPKIAYIDFTSTAFNQFVFAINNTSHTVTLFFNGISVLQLTDIASWPSGTVSTHFYNGSSAKPIIGNIAHGFVINKEATPVEASSCIFLTGKEPAALLTFDDGRDSVYTNAFIPLTQRGIKVTNYVRPSIFGDESFITLEQAQEMYAAGWAMSNHSTSHNNLASLTLEQVTADLGDCTAALNALGMTRASDHVAYPYGNYGGNVLQAMSDLGLKTGRSCDSGLMTYQSIHHSGLIHKLPICYVLNTTSLAQVKSWADAAKALGKTAIFLFHTITETPVDTYDWGTADFIAFLDYLLEIGLATKTIDEWYASYVERYP